jgi:hypothetical protein
MKLNQIRRTIDRGELVEQLNRKSIKHLKRKKNPATQQSNSAYYNPL